MRRITPRWKKISCTRCQAPAGSNCRMEDGNWMLVHPERRAAAENVTKGTIDASASTEYPASMGTHIDSDRTLGPTDWDRECQESKRLNRRGA